MVDLIVLAAGSGKRMQTPTNKQFLNINSKPILAHTLEKFYKHKGIDRIILAIKKDEEKLIRSILSEYGFRDIHLVHGGKERQDSVFNCLKYIKNLKDAYKDLYKDKAKNKGEYSKHIVLVHDGARPFVSSSDIDTCIRETYIHKATCLAVPAKDTIKVIDDDLNIKNTPDRSLLWCAQTPQTFDFNLLISAYESAYKSNILVSDDSSIVEAYSHRVKIIRGSYDNIKITTPEDISYAEYIENKRNDKINLTNANI